MSEQTFTLEQIIALAEELRRAGFDLGTQQYVAAQDLVIALAAHNRLPADPRRWQTLLAPIFCSSPAEQEEFARYFDAWLQRQPAFARQIAQAQREEARKETTTAAAEAQRRQWFKRKPVWIAAAALLVLLSGLIWLMGGKTDRRLEGQVFSDADDQPLAGRRSSF